jgi:hypothetical protein
MAGVAQTDRQGADRYDFGASSAAVDRLYALPLHDVPLQTPGLKKATMIKNAHLESVLELFRNEGTGSGQIEVDEIPQFFHQDEAQLEADIEVLRRLADLESFDVFSLRIELRRVGVDFTGTEALNLSPEKRAELAEYMASFTRPLIMKIYGQQQQADGADELIDLVRKPNREDAMRALKNLADTLKIGLDEVPKFLEECGDVFLSLSYFRDALDEVTSAIPDMIDWMNELQDNFQVRSDPNNQRVISEIAADLTDISTSLVGRFDMFDQRSQKLWDEIDPKAFENFRDFVRDHHVSLAAVLCGLTVKMKLWSERFPTRGGAPMKRLEFIKGEMLPGLARIKKRETGH